MQKNYWRNYNEQELPVNNNKKSPRFYSILLITLTHVQSAERDTFLATFRAYNSFPLTLPYILELFSVKDSGIDNIPLSPEAKKARIFEAVIRIALKRSEVRPLVMAIEDLHWIDDSSEESFKELLESISGSRVLLIFTYRPEFVHTWGGRSYHSQVNLNRLSNRESLMMVTNLLGAEGVDRELEVYILGRTEGVPFFIEEFIKSLIDLKVIEKRGERYSAEKELEGVSMPSTVQEVIMARVDSSPEGVKKLLQVGSVMGREFSWELMKGVSGISVNLKLAF